jgi:peptide/nickel transport system substrate-binding protein
MDLESIIERELTRRRMLAMTGAAIAGLMAVDPLRSAMTEAATSPKKGGTLTFADSTLAPNLAPFGAVAGATSTITVLAYDSLVTWDKHLKIQPALAESWTIPNKLTYVFKLRKGVKFHSGKELTSQDVIYSFGLQKAPPAPGVITTYYPAIDHVEAVDKYTVKFHMARPDATLMTYLAWGRYSMIVPDGMYTRIDPRSQADGTGPFQVQEFVPNDHITLVANRVSWRPFPYINKLVVKLLPDLQSRVSALRSGEVQGAVIDADTAKVLASNKNVQIVKGLTAGFREINITIKGDGKPWDKKAVRQAVNFAINRDDIIKKVYAGNAVYSSQIPAGYGNWPLSQKILRSKYEHYDLKTAKALMKKAGFSSGFPVTLQSIATPIDYTQLAQVVASNLSKIGINVTVQPLEIGIFAANNGKGDFEWQSTGRGMRSDPSGFMADFNPLGSTYKAWYQGGYVNDTLTKLINQGLNTTDPKKRKVLYDQMQQIVLTDWPEYPTVNPMLYWAFSSKVQGAYLSFDGFYTGIKTAWLK